MKKLLIQVLLMFYSAIGVTQEPNNQDVDLIETSLNDSEEIEESLENENILEDLYRLRLHPIDINDTLTDFTVLYQYNLITPIQAEAIRNYIQKHGKFITKKELYAVPNITIEQVEKVAPFISVDNLDSQDVNLINQLKQSRKSLIIRNQYLAEKQRGFQENDSTGRKFLGDRNRLYLKYRQQYRDRLSFGILGDKDAGEDFFSGSNKQGFDFYSAHLFYKLNHKIIKQAIIGDYEIKIGQGLVQWNGFALGKGSNASSVYLKGPRIRPYTSANEFNYNRGLSSELQLSNNLKSQLWYSNKNVDANVNQLDSLDDEIVAITSLQTSGLHRTEAEIDDKRAVNEQIIGVNLDYETSWFTVGLLAQTRKLSDSLSFSGRDYQRFLAKGQHFHHASIHYTGLKANTYFFGETAISNNNAIATINGVQKFFNSGLKATLVYRNFHPRYQSFYANTLSENTIVSNEQAVYLGLSFSPAKSVTIQTYFDRFWFPWNKARVDRPSDGTELFLKAQYSSNFTELEFRSRIEMKDVDQIGNTMPNNLIIPQQRFNNRIEIRHKPNSQLYLKTRIANSLFKTKLKDEKGYLIFQDLVYSLHEKPIKLYTRLAIYNTPSFDSRIYAYENDLLYNFSVPAYYGEGVRWYTMFNYQPTKGVKFWLKCGQTIFSDRDVISTGNTQIDGNTRTDLRLQMQWRF